MSKWTQFQYKLCAKPTPADIKWTELKGFLEQFGYEMKTASGSRRKFFHPEKNALIALHQPHPQPTVPKYAVEQVVSHLEQHGFI